jgi:hypothetical protein
MSAPCTTFTGPDWRWFNSKLPVFGRLDHLYHLYWGLVSIYIRGRWWGLAAQSSPLVRNISFYRGYRWYRWSKRLFLGCFSCTTSVPPEPHPVPHLSCMWWVGVAEGRVPTPHLRPIWLGEHPGDEDGFAPPRSARTQHPVESANITALHEAPSLLGPSWGGPLQGPLTRGAQAFFEVVRPLFFPKLSKGLANTPPIAVERMGPRFPTLRQKPSDIPGCT